MNKRMAVMVVSACFLLVQGGFARAVEKTPNQMVQEAKAQIKEVSIADVKKMIDAKENVIILDVRDKQEFDEGRIPGAINISRGMLEFKVAMIIPDKNAKIIVYCALDLRGPLATRAMNELGYKNAVNMVGGLKAWKEAGYPVVK
jgi:rhodanese-related sulfurtransferase